MIEFITVLVVDDSAFMRRAISKMLESEPDIRVIATARSGEEAIEKTQQHNPDIITMDVEMPGMGGLEAVRHIVANNRLPIIMVSALTLEGADTTFRALDAGAVDFVAKPDAAYTNMSEVARDLIAKIRTFARRGARPLAHRDEAAEGTSRTRRASFAQIRRDREPFACVAVGTSTGGPVALSRVIPHLSANFPIPIVIVQHMPLGFTRPLADRLNAQSKIRVVEAVEGMLLEPGSALVVPSGKQAILRRTSGGVELGLVADDGSSLHVPSVDATIEQVAEMYTAAGLGVILTGMGHDGVRGLRRLKALGGYVIGQDEASCVVYGMPRAAAREGLVDRVVRLDNLPHVLTELTGTR